MFFSVYFQVADWDEISAYKDARYVTPHEAYWRLNEYVLGKMSHTIVRLAVHKPEEQQVSNYINILQLQMQNVYAF